MKCSRVAGNQLIEMYIEEMHCSVWQSIGADLHCELKCTLKKCTAKCSRVVGNQLGFIHYTLYIIHYTFKCTPKCIAVVGNQLGWGGGEQLEISHTVRCRWSRHSGILIIIIISIIITRPRPAFGRLGLGGSSGGYNPPG